MANLPQMTVQTLKVLNALMEHPPSGLSGADIAKTTKLASGTLYPILARLEKSGLLKSEWEDVNPSEVQRPRKRLYRVTAVGDASRRSSLQELLPGREEMVWQS